MSKKTEGFMVWFGAVFLVLILPLGVGWFFSNYAIMKKQDVYVCTDDSGRGYPSNEITGRCD